MSRCHSRSDSTASHEPYHPCPNLEHDNNRSLPLRILHIASPNHCLGGAPALRPFNLPRATTRCPGHKPGKLDQRVGRNVGPRRRVVRLRPGRRDAPPVAAYAINGLGRRRAVGRRTSRSVEKLGEVPRAFLLVKHAASSRWRWWRSVRRTSWPVSRIL